MQNLSRIIAGLCAGGLIAPLAFAAPAASGDALEEVIVTANKVAEPLNKVAASIGVMTAAELESSRTVDLQDLVNHVPGVSSDFAGAPGTASFAVRGISAGGGTSTTTGMYVDDVSINFGNFGFAGAFEPAFFDMDRVEVLRGPQGTLYGAESFGGTIRFVNTAPKLGVTEGYVAADAYSQSKGAPGAGLQGAVNVPLASNLALRVAGIYQNDGGFIDHVNPAGQTVRTHTNGQTVTGARVSLLWEPTDSIKITPLFQYQHTDNRDTWTYDKTLGEYKSPRLLDEPLQDYFRLAAVTASFEFGAHTLTSVTSYVNREIDRIQDYTIYDVGYVAPPVVAYYNPPNADSALAQLLAVADRAYHVNSNEQYSQEFRLASHFANSGVTTLVGLLLNHEARGHVSAEDAAGFGAATTQLFGVGANDALNAAGPSFGFPPDGADLGDVLYAENTQLRFNRVAVYGEASYEPVDHLKGLKLTAGVRYSRITEKRTGFADGFFNGGYQSLAASFDENQTAPKFRASYQIDDDTLVYLSAAKGFRLGGQNSSLPLSCNAELQAAGLSFDPAYQTDSLWSYEAGAKVSSADHRLQLNASAFHIDWTNIVQSISFPVCGFGFNANFGKATSNGGDLALQWRAAPGLDIDLGVAYTDARFGHTVIIGGSPTTAEIPLNVPWSGTANVRYEWAFGTGRAYARGEYLYTDVSRGELYASGINFIRPAYSTLGASLGYKWDRWDLTLYGKNLTDAHPPLQQDTGLGYYNVATMRPRQIGLQLHLSF